MLRYSLLFLIVLLSRELKCQNAIWYEGSYDRPSGNLFWVYQGGMGHRIGYSLDVNEGEAEWGGFIGISRFKPKRDTFYYHDGPDYGIALFSNYTILQLCATIQKPFLNEKKVQPIIGIDVGYYYYAFEYEEHDSSHDLEGSVIEGRAAFCPHTGVQTTIADKLRIAFHVRYNFYISIGSSDPRATNYNPGVGRSDYFWTGSIVIGYIH